jgi:transcriptional regulator with XRE-family HTH domain
MIHSMDKPISITGQLAQNLRDWMDAHIELNTQDKVAARAGVSQATVGRMLAGSVAASIDRVESVAAAFGRTAAELLGGNSPLITFDHAAYASLPKSEQQKVESYIAFIIQQNKPVLSFVTVTKTPTTTRKNKGARNELLNDFPKKAHGRRARAAT